MTSTLNQDILIQLKQRDIELPVKKLYENYFDGIMAQIVANGGTGDDGADIFQEAVLILIDKVKTGQFRGESSIKTFLSAIARNLWLHELRTRGRRNNREMVYMHTEKIITNPVLPILNHKEKIGLTEVLDQIGETCKKILTGFYYEEKSMKDLLLEFNYENDQVLRNKKSKCMKKLKELISNNKALINTLKPLSRYE